MSLSLSVYLSLSVSLSLSFQCFHGHHSSISSILRGRLIGIGMVLVGTCPHPNIHSNVSENHSIEKYLCKYFFQINLEVQV